MSRLGLELLKSRALGTANQHFIKFIADFTRSIIGGIPEAPPIDMLNDLKDGLDLALNHDQSAQDHILRAFENATKSQLPEVQAYIFQAVKSLRTAPIYLVKSSGAAQVVNKKEKAIFTTFSDNVISAMAQRGYAPAIEDAQDRLLAKGIKHLSHGEDDLATDTFQQFARISNDWKGNVARLRVLIRKANSAKNVGSGILHKVATDIQRLIFLPSDIEDRNGWIAFVEKVIEDMDTIAEVGTECSEGTRNRFFRF